MRTIPCQLIIVALFINLAILSGFGIYYLQVGLDPQVSLVTNSPLNNFFTKLNNYTEIGPPGYLVLENINYTDPNDLEVINNITNALSTLRTI